MTTPTPPVTFVYADWIEGFPNFAACVGPGAAAGFFQRACNIFPNNPGNPSFCEGVPKMTSLLYLLTAHIAALAQRAANGAPPGRLNTASEGSVSSGFELNASGSPSESYYTQTEYGFEFWTATAGYRTARYIPMKTFVPTAIFPGRFYGRRW